MKEKVKNYYLDRIKKCLYQQIEAVIDYIGKVDNVVMN
jgi:hypothetical protein